jgi:hypothetical protein
MAAAGREPPAPPAIPKGGARRSPGDRERGGGRPGRGCCHHRCRRARRNAPGARRGGWCPRSPLARARRSESRGGSLGGRRAACARAAAGRGLAAEHTLRWQGPGDIDSVAIAPTGIAVAIETKTRTYDGRHLARVREQAAWLSRRRRRWARNGALGVMCVVRPRGVERVEHDLLIVSIDRLTHVLRLAARAGSDRRSTSQCRSRPSRKPADRATRALRRLRPPD